MSIHFNLFLACNKKKHLNDDCKSPLQKSNGSITGFVTYCIRKAGLQCFKFLGTQVLLQLLFACRGSCHTLSICSCLNHKVTHYSLARWFTWIVNLERDKSIKYLSYAVLGLDDFMFLDFNVYIFSNGWNNKITAPPFVCKVWQFSPLPYTVQTLRRNSLFSPGFYSTHLTQTWFLAVGVWHTSFSFYSK